MFKIYILHIPYIFFQVQSPSPLDKCQRQALILRIHSTVRVLGVKGHLFNNVYYMPALIIIRPSTFDILKNSQIIPPTVYTIVAAQVQKSSYRLVLSWPSFTLVCHAAYVMEEYLPWTWWRHQMETFSALLAICAGNSPVTSEFPAQRPVTQSFDVFLDLRLNKRLSKQSWGW